MLIWIAFIISFFFAMNIGGSGAAASMGTSYGSGAIRNKRIALFMCAIGVLLGAYFGGSEVVKTIGSGIIPSHLLDVKIVVIILSSAALALFIANILGIPLSTSEVTVGSVVGIGMAYHDMYVHKIIFIVLIWLIVPLIAFVITFSIRKMVQFLPPKKQKIHLPATLLTVFVVAAGMFEAFSAGMNNVANSVGPLVGAGLLSETKGVLIGGIFVALGAIFLGSRVIETNGKKITSLSLLEGSFISMTGASLVTIASVLGLPVPLVQITTSSIMGIGAAKNGFDSSQKKVVIKMLQVWIVSPILSLVLSYSLAKLTIQSDFYSIAILFITCLATLGIITLFITVKKHNTPITSQKENYKTN